MKKNRSTMQQPRAVVDNCLCMTPPPVPALDPITVDQALAGDPDAFARLYERYQPLVLQLAQGILRRHRQAEPATDLAAEVWLRLLERGPLQAFDPRRGSFHRFFKMVAWQQAFAVARRWGRRRPGEPLTSQQPDSAALDIVHQRIALHRVVERARLSARDCALLEERLVWNTTACELAGRLGCSVTDVNNHQRRLRTRLARAARELHEGVLCRAA